MSGTLAWQISGLISASLGIFLLYLGWSRKKRSWSIIIPAWMLVFVSIFSWGQTSGIDKGPALGIVALTMLALAAVLIVAFRTPIIERRIVSPRGTSAQQPASVWHEGLAVAGTVIAIIFVGLIVAITNCTAIFMACRAAGLEHTANLTITMTAFPLIWAMLATYIGYGRNKALKSVFLVAVFGISAVTIVATMQGVQHG